MAQGQRAFSTGAVVKVSVSLSHLHLTVDFYVMESPSFEFITGVLAVEALQRSLDFRLEQATLISSSKKATLPFEYTFVEVLADYSLEKDSASVSSSLDAAPGIDKDTRDKLVVSLAEDLRLSDDNCCANFFWQL